jgi:transaldolase
LGDRVASVVCDKYPIHGIQTEIVSASMRHTMHIHESELAGVHIATIPYGILNQMIKEVFHIMKKTSLILKYSGAAYESSEHNQKILISSS